MFLGNIHTSKIEVCMFLGNIHTSKIEVCMFLGNIRTPKLWVCMFLGTGKHTYLENYRYVCMSGFVVFKLISLSLWHRHVIPWRFVPWRSAGRKSHSLDPKKTKRTFLGNFLSFQCVCQARDFLKLITCDIRFVCRMFVFSPFFLPFFILVFFTVFTSLLILIFIYLYSHEASDSESLANRRMRRNSFKKNCIRKESLNLIGLCICICKDSGLSPSPASSWSRQEPFQANRLVEKKDKTNEKGKNRKTWKTTI